MDFWLAKAASTALGEAVSDFSIRVLPPVVAVLIGFAVFVPWGAATGESAGELLASIPVLVVKLAIFGAGLAFVETLSAKLRVFRAPEFLATAFMLAVLGLLVHLLLGA